MIDLDVLLKVNNIITALSFGITVNNLVVWPMIRRNKANKLIKYKLQAISKYDGYLIDKECLLDNASLNDRNEALKREIVQSLNLFLEDITNYIGEENSRLMYTNLKTASFEVFKRRLPQEGLYNPILNRVRIKKITALLHELLHLASSYYDKDRDVTESGFFQVDYKTSAEIGRGLNEGYTELLRSRIDEDDPASCKWLVIIARLFELFFDDYKEMENLYFRHNLPGFIQHMEKYIPYDKIIELLLRLDRINAFYEKQVPIFVYLEIINIEKELYGYFVKSNKNPDKLIDFENIIREELLSNVVFSQGKMDLIKDNIKSEEEIEETVEEKRKLSA
ncbi:MAG: hypothetical protein K2G03_03435 [Bacilli bacterium]|nr:hypothetical protein [Bacilli bacterium]